MWLASIVTEGDHRTVSGETSLKSMHPTLRARTAQSIEPLDVSDDRLRHRLQHVSKAASWHQIARDFKARRIEVHAWPQDVRRWDAPTVAGAHEGTAGGL